MFKQSLFSTYNIVDALAVELVEAGIMTKANKLESGIWTGKIDTTRIFNHNDGTPSSSII